MIGLVLGLALILWLLISTFMDSGKWFSFAIFIGLLTVFVLFGTAFLSFIMLNLKVILIGAISYFVLGGIWSVFKWYRLNIKVRNSYNDAVSKGLNHDHAISRAKEVNHVRSVPPSPAYHKSTITFWIVSWPFSIVTWILGDLVVDVCNYVYELLAGIYTSITKNIFKDFPKE